MQIVPAAGAVVLWFLFGLMGVGVTGWLVHRIWKRRKEMPRATRLVASVFAASAISGALGMLVGFVKLFGAVGGESVDPSQKARILALGISEAINCVGFGLAIWVPSVVAAFVITNKTNGRAQ